MAFLILIVRIIKFKKKYIKNLLNTRKINIVNTVK